jgi:hypothetical protein
MKDRIGAVTQAFMDHQAMEETKSYLERGRRFEGLSVEDLNRGWAAAFTAVCADGDRRRATDLDDFGAELGLRKLEKPDHLVRDAMKIVQQRIRDARPEMFEAVKEAIGKFMDEMDKPKN